MFNTVLEYEDLDCSWEEIQEEVQELLKSDHAPAHLSNTHAFFSKIIESME